MGYQGYCLMGICNGLTDGQAVWLHFITLKCKGKYNGLRNGEVLYEFGLERAEQLFPLPILYHVL